VIFLSFPSLSLKALSMFVVRSEKMFPPKKKKKPRAPYNCSFVGIADTKQIPGHTASNFKLVRVRAFTWFDVSDSVKFLPDPTLLQPRLVAHGVNA